MAEIASASVEPATRIDQVSNAVAEIDRALQQNAAGAEESDGASEEMIAHAENMKGFVKDLVILVGRHTARNLDDPADFGRIRKALAKV